MGKIVVVKPTGEYVHLPADKSLDLRLIYLAIGASTVERIKVRYEGRVRDAYLDEEGFLNGKRPNAEIKKLAEAYYGQPCQTFVGSAAIWIPTPRKEKADGPV
jgi:hypothetical protein